ncbi:MAG TPA: DUF6065 family protein [Geminicoccaceae bacterium]|nr:DUF6065 family protein [Geminicoccaceae bacterium]
MDEQQQPPRRRVRLTAYAMGGAAPPIRPAPRRRDWMDATPEQYAYRCLPLAIANVHGWEILCAAPFEATWTGGASKRDLKVRALDREAFLPVSHFGSGVLTFHTGHLFRTEPGYNLWVAGPVNQPKDGVHALSGLIEADWSPYAFTMNWVFTRPCTVRFERGEPVCSFFVVPRGLIEEVDPEIRHLDADPETLRDHEQWRLARGRFIEDLAVIDSTARKEKWQKNYYTGYYPDGQRQAPEHRIKLRVREFKRIE